MKVIIIGLGSIAKKHIQAILTINPETKIFALRNKSKDKVNGVENISNAENIREKIDFVLITNPTKLHAETILDSLKFNCPIFIEKPPLSDLSLSDVIINKIQEKKTITYIAYNLRFHPALIFLKKFLECNQKKINEVNVYCGSYLPNWRSDVDYRKIYSANKELGGGVHLDLIHEIDYSTWLFGFPKKTYSLLTSQSSLMINSIDYAQYNLVYENFILNIKLNYYRKDTKREIEILTENETIHCDLINCVVTNTTTNTILYSKNYNVMETYIEQMKFFLKLVKNEIKPMNSFEQSLKVLKIALND